MIENILNRFLPSGYTIDSRLPYNISGANNIIHLNLKPHTYLAQMYVIDPIASDSNYKGLEAILSKYITLLREIYVQAKAVHMNDHWYLLIYARDHEYLHEACHDLRLLSNHCLQLHPCLTSTKRAVINRLLLRSVNGTRELHRHIMKIDNNYYTILNVRPPKQSLHAFWLHNLTSLPNVCSVISFSTLKHNYTNRSIAPEISLLQAQDPDLTPDQQMRESQNARKLVALGRSLQNNSEILYNYSVQLIVSSHSESALKRTVHLIENKFNNFKFTNGLYSTEDLFSPVMPLSHHIDNNINHYLIQSYDLGGSYPFISPYGNTVSYDDPSMLLKRSFNGGQTSSRDLRILGNVTLPDALLALACIVLFVIH